MQKRFILLLILLAGWAMVAYSPEQGESSTSLQPPNSLVDEIFYTGGSFSFDEKRILISSNETGVYNAYSIPVHGGKAVELTNSKNSPVHAITYFPEDDRLLFNLNKKDHLNKHLYLREGDGSIRDLVPIKGSHTEFFGWNQERDGFFYLSNKRNLSDLDIYEMNIHTLESDLVFLNDGKFSVKAISSDKKFIALKKSVGTKNALYVFDMQKNELISLFPDESVLFIEPAAFSLNGHKLYCVLYEGEESYIISVECESNKEAIEQREKGKILSMQLSPQGTFRLITLFEDGKIAIKVVDNTSGKPIKLPRLPEGNVISAVISQSENKMLLTISGNDHLSDLYLVDFAKGSLQKLTQHPKSSFI